MPQKQGEDINVKLNEENCENVLLKSDLECLINQDITNNDAIKMDNLKKRRKRLVIFLLIVILSLFSIIFFGTLCSDG